MLSFFGEFVSLYLGLGFLSCAVVGVRGEHVPMLKLFLPIGIALRATGALFLLSLASVVGLILLVVPGILVFVMWVLALPLIVDGGAKVFDSFSSSAKLTKGSRG